MIKKYLHSVLERWQEMKADIAKDYPLIISSLGIYFMLQGMIIGNKTLVMFSFLIGYLYTSIQVKGGKK